jgi:hypothetical protein
VERVEYKQPNTNHLALRALLLEKRRRKFVGGVCG